MRLGGTAAQRLCALPDIKITEETTEKIFIDCPVHASHSHKSCVYDKLTGKWFCFGCGVGGDLLQLVEFVLSGTVTKGVGGVMSENHRRARDWLAEYMGMPLLSQMGKSAEEIERVEMRRMADARTFECMREVVEYWHVRLLNTIEQVCELKQQYGFTDELINRLKIGYADNAAGTDVAGKPIPSLRDHLRALGYSVDEQLSTGLFAADDWSGGPEEYYAIPLFRNRWVFPYWRGGKAVYAIARKTRWIIDPKDAEAKYRKALTHQKREFVSPAINNDELFNEYDATQGKLNYRVIAEGITDCLAAIQNDFPTTSPVTTHIKRNDWPRLTANLKRAGCEVVYLVGDNEISQAGKRGAENNARRFEAAGIQARIITLPLGAEQVQAREALAVHGIIEGLDSKQIGTIKTGLEPEQAAEIDRLIADAKIDLNDYFKEHTADDFRELMRKSVTRLEGILNPYIEVLQDRKRNAELLNDKTFLSALAEASQTDAAHSSRPLKWPSGERKRFAKR